MRWGVAGCGWVACDYAIPAIVASRNGKLAALYDISERALATAAARWPDAARSDDLDHFLGQIDAVYIATPNHAHRAIAQAAARAGVAVFCEKPIATSLEDARAIVAGCARAGVPYATAFDQRFHPAHQHVLGLLRAGALGQVFAIRIAYCCWVGRTFSGDNWRVDPARAGGGAMMDLAPHGLDLASVLLGEDLHDIAAIGQSRVQDYAVEDGALLIARSSGGVLVQIHVAYNCPETYPRRRLEILGTDAQIVATDTMGQTPGGTVVLTDAHTGTATQLDIEGADRSPFLNQIEAFAGALIEGTAFPYTPAHDLHVMALVMQAQQQIARGLANAA